MKVHSTPLARVASDHLPLTAELDAPVRRRCRRAASDDAECDSTSA